MRTTRQNPIVIFLLLLLVASCTDHEPIEQETPDKKISYTSLDKEKELSAIINKLGFVSSKDSKNLSSAKIAGVPAIDIKTIMKVLQPDSIHFSFSFQILDSEQGFRNLILKQREHDYLGFIMEYEIEKENPYTGTVRRYDLHGKLLGEKRFGDAQAKSKNASGKIEDCSRAVRFEYADDFGAPCANIWDQFDDGCYLTLTVEECGSGGSGAGGNSGGTTGGGNPGGSSWGDVGIGSGGTSINPEEPWSGGGGFTGGVSTDNPDSGSTSNPGSGSGGSTPGGNGSGSQGPGFEGAPVDEVIGVLPVKETTWPGANNGLPDGWWSDEEWLDENFILAPDQDYGELSVEEKRLINLYPASAYFIGENAKQETFDRFVINGLNDKSDAFRHALWNALNERDCGDTRDLESIAKLFSDAHESEVPAQLALEKEMDLWNNAVGLSIGDVMFPIFTTDNSLADEVMLKLTDGSLRYLSPTLTPQTDPNFWGTGGTRNKLTATHGIISSTALIPTNP